MWHLAILLIGESIIFITSGMCQLYCRIRYRSYWPEQSEIVGWNQLNLFLSLMLAHVDFLEAYQKTKIRVNERDNMIYL